MRKHIEMRWHLWVLWHRQFPLTGGATPAYVRCSCGTRWEFE